MTAAARAELAGRQAALVNALVRGAAEPAGFDARWVRTTAASLRRKRARAIARAWPRLSRALGPDFAAGVSRYLAEHPATPAGGAMADGRRLARCLAAEGRLPWEGRLELLSVELRWRWRAGGQRRPRRFGFALAMDGRSARAALGLLAPLLGEHWLFLRR